MSVRIVIALAFLLTVQTNRVSSYKILGIFPSLSRSHYHMGRGLLKGLAAAGHEVTIVTPFSEKDSIQNYNEIKLTNINRVERAYK